MINPATGADPLYTSPPLLDAAPTTPAPAPTSGQSLTSGLLSYPSPSSQPATPAAPAPPATAPAKWEVTPDQTVQGQVKKIIAEDSPLMQQAAATGMQQGNSRGLLNSTMAIGAAQGEVYKAATPIAQQDAATNANAAASNAGFGQEFGRMDKQQGFDLTKMDKAAAARLGEMNLEQKNTLEQYAKQQGYNLETMSAQQINELHKASVLQGYDLTKMDRATANSLTILDANTVADMAKMAKAQGYSLDTMSAQQANDLAKASVLNGYEVAKGLADRQTQLDVNQLLVDNKKLVDTMASAQKALGDYNAALVNINNNKDLSREKDPITGKSPYQDAIDSVAQNLKSSLAVIGAISGIKLPDLDFGDSGDGAAGDQVGGTKTAAETAAAKKAAEDAAAKKAAEDAAKAAAAKNPGAWGNGNRGTEG